VHHKHELSDIKLLITLSTTQPLSTSLLFLFSLFFSLSFTLLFDFLLAADTKQYIRGADKKCKQEYGGRTKAVTSNTMNGMNTK
jgi:hypothetical protein